MTNASPAVDFCAVFQTDPGLNLLLSPDLIIVAASDAYLAATMTERTAITGRHLFEIFPDNPNDKYATGVSNLRTSLNRVITEGKPNVMDIQQYDIRRWDGSFEIRYWSPVNTPVFSAEKKLIYIIHKVTDVTTSYFSENKLRKSEKDYALLVNSVKDYAIFMIDLHGCVASWNSGAEKIKGYTEAEIIGQPIDIFYTDESKNDGEPARNLWIAKEKGNYEAEGWRVRKDGKLFWANIIFTALRDEQGVLYGYSKITRDITEKKKWHEEMELLSRQINQSNDAIFTTDAERKIKSWNKGAEKLYGYTIEEVLGKDSHMLLRSALTPEEVDLLIKEIARNDYWSGELRRKTKDGRDIYVLSSVTTLRDNNGIINGYVAVSFDVTGQKKLREQVNHLASLVQQSSEAIISRGIDNRFISWNSGAERLFGYSKEEAIGKTPNDLRFTGYNEQEITGVGQQIIEKGSWNSEKEFYHKNGSSFFGTVNANALKNEAGEITSLVFIIKDMSLRKELEEQLKKYNTELELEVKARTEEIIKSEKRFRALIENSNDVVSLMDESFRILYRSASAVRITGWTDEEMTNADGTKNIHPDDFNKAKGIVKELMANPGKPINCLFRNLHKDGYYLWMEGVVTNLLHDEYVKAIVFNFRDVTTRIEAEAKLSASEMRFRLLIENSTDGIDMSDEFSNNIYRSPGAIKITGILPKENQRGFTHPDDVETIKNLQEEFIKKPGVPIAFQARFLHALGHYIWVEGTVTNLLHVEGVQAFVTNFRDITQRKEAEHQKEFDHNNLHALINNTHDLVWSVDQNLKLITFNKAFEKMITILTGEEPVKGGHILNPSFGERQLKQFKKYYRRALKGETFTEEEHSKIPKEIWSEISFYPIYENKSVAGTACFSRNITGRKRNEAELQKSFLEKQSLAERMAAILNTLPANIALLNDKGIIIDVNNEWKKFADNNGMNAENYCIGESYIKVSKTANKEEKKDGLAVAKGVADVLQNKLNEFVYEYPCHSPLQRRWFRMVVTPLHEENYRGAVVMHIDISEVRRLEEERLESKIQEQQKVTRAMLRAQEKERHNIGIELHDNVNQILVGTNLILSHAKGEKGNTKELIVAAMGYLKEAINENRKIAHVFVSPDEDQNLLEQLQRLSFSMLEMSGIQVEFSYSGFKEELLEQEIKMTVYRIVQEQSTNIVKYAKATQVQIELDTKDQIFRCRISDNGIGMDIGQVKKGIGLKNIKDRLGLFNGASNITTALGKGFTMEFFLPLTKQ